MLVLELTASIFSRCLYLKKFDFTEIVIGNLSQQDKDSQVVEAAAIKCRLKCVFTDQYLKIRLEKKIK